MGTDTAVGICCKCKEEYALASYCIHNGEQLPWLVVEGSPTNLYDALDVMVCQRCHGYKPGRSLQQWQQDMEPSESVQEHAVIQPVLPVPVIKSEVKPPQPVSIARPVVRPERVEVRPVSSVPAVVHRERVEVRPVSIALPDRKERVEVRPGAEVPAKINRQENSGSTRSAQPRVQRSVRAQARPVRPEPTVSPPSLPRAQEPATLGQQMLSQLEAAHVRGDRDRFEQLHALAVAAKLEHLLTRDAIKYERQIMVLAERVVQAVLRHLKEVSFKETVRQARSLLTRMRREYLTRDMCELDEKLEMLIEIAWQQDPDKRSRSELIQLIGTSAQERFGFFLAVRYAPDTHGSSGTVIAREACNRTGRRERTITCKGKVIQVITYGQQLPMPNKPIPIVTGGGSLPEDIPQITYAPGAKYGREPFLIFPTDRYHFTCAEGEFMRAGTRARMELDREFMRWVIWPHTDNGTELSVPRFGSFASGYMTADQINLGTSDVLDSAELAAWVKWHQEAMQSFPARIKRKGSVQAQAEHAGALPDTHN